jgi:large subunit ribosomal protein L25
MTTLDFQVRDKSVKLDKLRKEGKMPAVFYGKKQASTSISILEKDFLKVWRDAGESGVVTLKDKTNSVDALIHSVEMDPRSDKPLHADFYVFEKGKKIEVSVPLEFVGIAPAIKDLGGTLVKALHEIKISADPQHIPHDIKVDISSLATFEDQILAENVVLPTGVVLMELASEVVASVSEPKGDEPEEPSAPVDLSAIEVEKKGKKDEEEAPAAE